MGARILVVEDNPANLDLISFLLGAFAHEAIETTSGRAGIDAALREPPDLILMDIQMPEMDGFETMAEIRSHPSLSETPIVALTALAMVGDREKALRAGFDGYITKPIMPENFSSQLDEFLSPELRSQGLPPLHERQSFEAMRSMQAEPERNGTQTLREYLVAELDCHVDPERRSSRPGAADEVAV